MESAPGNGGGSAIPDKLLALRVMRRRLPKVGCDWSGGGGGPACLPACPVGLQAGTTSTDESDRPASPTNPTGLTNQTNPTGLLSPKGAVGTWRSHGHFGAKPRNSGDSVAPWA